MIQTLSHRQRNYSSIFFCFSFFSFPPSQTCSLHLKFTLTHTQQGQLRGSNWVWKKIVFCNYFPTSWSTCKILPTQTEAISFLLKVSDTLITLHRGRFEMHNRSPTHFLVYVYLIFSPITAWISLKVSQRQFVKECRNPWATCSLMILLFVIGMGKSWLTGGLTQWLN